MESGLIEIVNTYLESHPNKSAMANKGDFDRKTLNRLMNGKRISSQSAFKILEVALKKDYFKIYSKLNNLYPDEEWIKSGLNILVEQETTVPPDLEIEKFLQRSSTSQDLGHLLMRKIGISRAFIQKRFGEFGIEQVEELVEAGKVIELEDGSLRFKDYTFSFSPEMGKSIAINNGVKYDSATFGTADSMIASFLWNTSQDGLDGAKRIFLKAASEAVLFVKAHPGYMPVSFSAVMVKALPGFEGDAKGHESNRNNIN